MTTVANRGSVRVLLSVALGLTLAALSVARAAPARSGGWSAGWRAAYREEVRRRTERFQESLKILHGLGVAVEYPADEIPERTAKEFLVDREACLRRMADALGAFGEEGRRARAAELKFRLFRSLEEKVMVSGGTEEAGADPSNPDLVPAVSGDGDGIEDLAQARALARRILGASAPRAAGLEWGLAVHLAGSWKGRSPGEVSSRLASAGTLPTLSEILSPVRDEDEISPLFLAPAAGSFVDFIISRIGAANFLDAVTGQKTPAEGLVSAVSSLRKGPRPTSAASPPAPGSDPPDAVRASEGAGPGNVAGTPERIPAPPEPTRADHGAPAGAGFRAPVSPAPTNAALDALETAWLAALPSGPGPPDRRPAPGGFQRGVCLAHTNSPSRGYGGERIGDVLDALVSEGVSWISVTPFGFQRSASDTRIFFRLEGPGSETDESMRRVIREAHARGLAVLYKPHLWVDGHSVWSGEIAMKDAEGWRRWFASYRRFIIHHALLAEEERVEIFSAANELALAAGREAEWRGTIAAIRRVFGGAVTYAANWGEEDERVRFWDALDFVGVNCYYPLSADPRASDDSLYEGARSVAARLAAIGQSAGRPVLLTEVGFASRSSCWVDPHREIDGAAPDNEAQRRSYDAILKAFTGPRFRGLYWWKVESDPAIGGPEDSSFTPRGKPAEREFAAAYARLRDGRANAPRARGAP